MKRKSKDRFEMREILNGTIKGNLVILDIEDLVHQFNATGRVGYYTIDDWVGACHEIGTDTNIIIGEKEYFPESHPLGFQRKIMSAHKHRRDFKRIIPSPLRPLEMHFRETDREKFSFTKVALETEEDFDALIAYLRLLRNSGEEMIRSLGQIRKTIGDRGFLTVFVSQPMEMYYVILQEQMVNYYLMMPEKYREAMEEVEKTSHFIIDCAAEADADMIMFGGAGTEIFDPEMIEHYIIEPSKGYVRHCEEKGLFSLMHCCGHTRILLDNKWFDDLRPTIFESFTKAPLGNIDDPVSAVRMLPDEIFFKGGLHLQDLLLGSPAEVGDMTHRAYRSFGNRRYILAGTCLILTGTSRENLMTVTSTVMQYDS
jgi:uroporphyrinogen-III decarboxylase